MFRTRSSTSPCQLFVEKQRQGYIVSLPCIHVSVDFFHFFSFCLNGCLVCLCFRGCSSSVWLTDISSVSAWQISTFYLYCMLVDSLFFISSHEGDINANHKLIKSQVKILSTPVLMIHGTRGLETTVSVIIKSKANTTET